MIDKRETELSYEQKYLCGIPEEKEQRYEFVFKCSCGGEVIISTMNNPKVTMNLECPEDDNKLTSIFGTMVGTNKFRFQCPECDEESELFVRKEKEEKEYNPPEMLKYLGLEDDDSLTKFKSVCCNADVMYRKVRETEWFLVEAICSKCMKLCKVKRE